MTMEDRAAERFLMRWHAVSPGGSEPCFTAYRDPAGRSSYQALRAGLGRPEGPVLDLACGNGVLARTGDRFGWVGLDLSPHELAVARVGLGPAAPLVRGHAARLPVATGSLAAVASHMALMLMRPLPAVLGECARVLRPGGRLVAVVSGGRGLGILPDYVDLLRRRWAAGAPLPPNLGDPRCRDPDALRALLTRAGFRSAQVQELPVQRRSTPVEAWDDLSGMYDVLALTPAEAADLGREAVATFMDRRGLDGRVRVGFGLRLVTAVRAEPTADEAR